MNNNMVRERDVVWQLCIYSYIPDRYWVGETEFPESELVPIVPRLLSTTFTLQIAHDCLFEVDMFVCL